MQIKEIIFILLTVNVLLRCYFADMSSKSANYCYPSRDKNTGLMLLAEVALGDMYELTQAQYMDQPPPVRVF